MTDHWPPELRQLAAELQGEGPRRYSAWRDAAFDAMVSGPANRLWWSLSQSAKPPESAVKVMSDYLRLAQEAVGLGYISDPDRTTSFLDDCLRRLIPRNLARVAAARRSETLASVWNLAEGLTREPAWLGEYVRCRIDGSVDLAKLDQHLVKLLEPVLAPPPSSGWQGRGRLTIVNLRDADDVFLPGEMYMAAPSIVCVQDRRRPACIGLLLQSTGAEVLGRIEPLARSAAEATIPQPVFSNDAVGIGRRDIKLPLLGRPLSWVAAPTGCLIASAVDSQRLWIVDEL